MFDRQAQGPDRPRSSNRVVRVPVDRQRYLLLDELAGASSVQPEQLAAIWLRQRIDEEAGARALLRAADQLVEIRALLAIAGDGPRPARSGTGPVRRRRSPGGPRESLHNEIVAVLEQHGQPMTAAEIARAIRERGQYRPPRSGNPISGAQVSRRIANPYYRSLFERRGRQVRLAADADR